MTFNLEPCKRDKLGRNVKDYRVRDFYEKISEELLEAHTEAIYDDRPNEAKELIQVMTVCASRIRALGWDVDDNQLAAIQQAVIERNRARGYFEEVTR